MDTSKEKLKQEIYDATCLNCKHLIARHYCKKYKTPAGKMYNLLQAISSDWLNSGNYIPAILPKVLECIVNHGKEEKVWDEGH